MPPSHHSHSSSHHSSSHHSSSRSHSSSHVSHHSSSSYRSTPHYRSSSSYGSGFFGSSLGSTARRAPAVNPPHVYRKRTSQPTGYKSHSSGFPTPRMHTCSRHDYVFYPVDWVDSISHRSFKKGYYDENGAYYDNIAFFDAKTGKYTTKLVCNYCDTEIKAEWTEGGAPHCPNCGATLHEVITGITTDTVVDSFNLNEGVEQGSEAYYNYGGNGSGNGYSGGGNYTRSNNNAKYLGLPISIVIFSIMICCCGVSFSQIASCTASTAIPALEQTANNLQTVVDNSENVYPDYNNAVSVPPAGITYNSSKIYVDAIGRECMWYDEYESYYDQATDCYFWYNTDVEPSEWQYWYEGVSSDYGEYGWMVFDEYEQRWYIEETNGHWAPLPEIYDTSYMWHIE